VKEKLQKTNSIGHKTTGHGRNQQTADTAAQAGDEENEERKGDARKSDRTLT
jgi:hypothetical protein